MAATMIEPDFAHCQLCHTDRMCLIVADDGPVEEWFFCCGQCLTCVAAELFCKEDEADDEVTPPPTEPDKSLS